MINYMDKRGKKLVFKENSYTVSHREFVLILNAVSKLTIKFWFGQKSGQKPPNDRLQPNI